MSSKFVLVLGFVAMSTMALGCGDSGTGGTGGTGEVPGDPDASWVQLSEMTFEEIIPGIVSFATPWGDLAAGPHATFARVFAGTGIPPHLHSNDIRSVVFEAPMEIPVPSNETEPGSLTLGSYMFVPGTTQHAMNCTNDTEDCLFLLQQDGAFDFAPTDPPAGDPPIDRDPGAEMKKFENVEFVELIPDVLDFGPLWGDFMTGAHGTIARVKAGTGIPPHWHSLEARGYVLQGMVEVPVPFDQTNPLTMTLGAFFLVPAEAEHAMNCVSDSMDCLFLLVQDGAFDVTFLDI